MTTVHFSAAVNPHDSACCSKSLRNSNIFFVLPENEGALGALAAGIPVIPLHKSAITTNDEWSVVDTAGNSEAAVTGVIGGTIKDSVVVWDHRSLSKGGTGGELYMNSQLSTSRDVVRGKIGRGGNGGR